MFGLVQRFVMLITIFLQINTLQVQAQVSAYEVNLKEAKSDKALYGQAFLNLTQTPTLVECFDYCIKNCRCTAFQMCQKTECQLLSSSRFLTPSSFLSKQGCTYYDMLPRKQATSRCESIIDCCTTSNPCLNGGTCLPPLPNSRKRFRCKCPDGYTGEQCDQCKPGYTGEQCDQCKPAYTGEQCDQCKPGYTGEQCEHPCRSCRGYTNGSRIPGNYSVLDDNSKPFQVFCDFDKNSSMAWTLIQSFSLDNNAVFKKSPLRKDFPQNQNDPSWLKYRLSKSRMESIQQDSTKWRLTCRYEIDGVVYTDYLRAWNNQLNILTFNNNKCVKVEYINVRGNNCTECTAGIWQKNAILHFTSGYNNIGCSFKHHVYQLCKTAKEQNFGWYACVNHQHRCSSSGDATTQTWFGGN